MKTIIMMLLAAVLVVITGCASVEEEPVAGPKVFVPVSDEGQLPEKVAQDASSRYEGSMDAASGSSAITGQASGLSVVLGPINSENVGASVGTNGDAGQRIREVIAQRITAQSGITLVDAPEERFADDSPRPDLARKGIKLVVKGVASYNEKAGQTTVFLRAVKTSTGKVSAVASGRAVSADEAAGQAATRLVEKLKGRP